MATKAWLLLVLFGTVAVGGAWPARPAFSTGPPPCREGALVSLETGKVLRRFSARSSAPGYTRGPLIPGGSAVSDGRGGWFVAGVGLERLRGDGRLDHTWHAQVPRSLGLLRQVTRVGDRLYVAGRRHVMAIDAVSGAPFWTSAEVGLARSGGSAIMALAATPSTVYIGGAFSRVGTERRSQLAAFNAITGRLLPWQAPRLTLYAGSFPVVATMAVTKARVYLGGGFTKIGGAPRRSGVAAVRRSDGRLTSFFPREGIGDLLALAVVGRQLLISADRGGVFDTRTGARLHVRAPLSSASTIALRGSTAYFGGTIRNSVGGHNLLAMDLRTGKLEPWFPQLAPFVSVGTIALSGDRAFVGGEFCAHL
jgi:outer membrane protein assembly factor BamB